MIICCDCLNFTANIQQNAVNYMFKRDISRNISRAAFQTASRSTENVILDPQKLSVYSNLGCLFVHQAQAKSLLIFAGDLLIVVFPKLEPL